MTDDRPPRSAVPDRLIAWLLLPAAGALVSTLGEFLLASPNPAWDGARLAPSFALKHGHRLYYGLKDGPALHTIYGPVGPLLYYPPLERKARRARCSSRSS